MATSRNGPAIDPIQMGKDDVERRIRSNAGSVFSHEPIRGWLVGLAVLKSQVGAQLPWDDIETRINQAVEEALKPKAKIVVSGKERAPTKEELEHLRAYSVAPRVTSSMKKYVRRAHPELWTALRATANGRGTGVRSDEADGEA